MSRRRTKCVKRRWRGSVVWEGSRGTRLGVTKRGGLGWKLVKRARETKTNTKTNTNTKPTRASHGGAHHDDRRRAVGLNRVAVATV